MVSWGDVVKFVVLAAAFTAVLIAGRTVDRRLRQAEYDAKAREWAAPIHRFRYGVDLQVENGHPCLCTGSTGQVGEVR